MKLPVILFDTPDNEQKPPEPKVVDVDKMTDDQIDNLGISDLKKIEIPGEDDQEPIVVPPEPEQKKPVEKDEKKLPEEKIDGKKPDENIEKEPEKEPDKPKPLVDQISELESVKQEDRSELQVSELRRLHSEKKMFEALAERDLSRKETEEANKAIPDEPEEKFDILSEAEEKKLMRDDPDEYDKYTDEKSAFQTKQSERLITVQKTTWNNFVDYYKIKEGIEGDFDPKKDKDFLAYIKSDDFFTMDNFITENYQTIKGSHTLKQFQAADRSINHDSYVSKAEIRGREQAIKDTDPKKFIDQSTFDIIPKESGSKTVKKASDLSEDEIDNLGKSGYEAYEKQMEIESGSR